MRGVSASFEPNSTSKPPTRPPRTGEALVIDIDGFEGPLHALLALARTQKVDLLKLSITKLADQYLAFVQRGAQARASPWPPTIWSWPPG